MSSWLYYLNANRAFNWGENILFRGPSYFFYALLTPPVLLFIERLRQKTDSFGRHIIPHLFFGTGFVITHIFFSLLLVHLIRVVFMGDDRSFSTVIYINKFILLSSSFDSFFTYATIAAAAYGLSYYKIFSEEKLRSVELEAGLANARLDAIRNKLNPHFLFNALNSVSAMIHINPDKADDMVIRISDLLRRVTDEKGEPFTTLKEEIAFTEEYLALQKIRFGDRLQYVIAYDSADGNYPVPRFLLQPIVENSIKHSLEPYNNICIIDIRAIYTAQGLKITVQDNGPGISQNHKSGTGTSILKAQLESAYKDRYTLTINNRESGGLITEIIIPASKRGMD